MMFLTPKLWFRLKIQTFVGYLNLFALTFFKQINYFTILNILSRQMDHSNS